MVKDAQTVIKEFNELVNMTPDELEKWLKSDDSRSAGWPKDDGDNDGGESVGHDSGRKIVEILRANPDGKPDGYTDEQVDHMRKVVSYCKRHLAQEEKTNDQKSAEEVKKTKSYASLKNWGHDPLKKRGEGGEEKEEAAGEEEEENEGEDKQAGDKRKKSEGAQGGANKKRETRQGKGQKKEDDEEEEEDEQEEEEEDEDDGEEKKAGNGQKKQPNGQKNQKNGSKKQQDNDNEEDEQDQDDQEEQGGDGKTPKKGPKKGDTVSWNWGSGNPQGKVLDVKAEKTTIETKNGNEVSRDGDPEDPAVVLDTGKSKAIKSNHELN